MLTVELYKALTALNCLWNDNGRDVEKVKNSPEYAQIVDRMTALGWTVKGVVVESVTYQLLEDPVEHVIEHVRFVVE